jgi:hypothetical protein
MVVSFALAVEPNLSGQATVIDSGGAQNGEAISAWFPLVSKSRLANFSTVHRDDRQIPEVKSGPRRTASFPHMDSPEVRFV